MSALMASASPRPDRDAIDPRDDGLFAYQANTSHQTNHPVRSLRNRLRRSIRGLSRAEIRPRTERTPFAHQGDDTNGIVSRRSFDALDERLREFVRKRVLLLGSIQPENTDPIAGLLQQHGFGSRGGLSHGDLPLVMPKRRQRRAQ
jgi:hypothetical protein